jgi:hypothetical protein
MSCFILTTIVSAIVAAIFGVIAWVITNVFADPLLQFERQRRAIHESLFFTDNVHKDNKELLAAGMEELRRHGASLNALWQTCPAVIKWWLRLWGNDLELAFNNLTGLSNALASGTYQKEGHRHQIEKGLRFPLSSTREEIDGLGELGD